MRVLSIGTDRKLFEEGSASRIRHEAYAKRLGALDVIVFAGGDGKATRSGALSVIPTNSVSRLLYGFDALRIARKLPKPDVVTVQDPFETGFIGWLVARRFDVPLHVQVHTDFLSPEYARLSLLNRLRVWIAGVVLRRAAHIRVVSERVGKSIERRYNLKKNVSVLPIFANTIASRQIQVDPALERAFERFDKKILFVGRLEPEKNPSLAVRAFAEVAPERTCLIIVGDGSERKTLGTLAKKLGLMEGPEGQRVFFEEKTESAKYYPVADLVLVTSHYEGYGLVTIEALAPGVPVLSTDVGIAREAGAIVTLPGKFAEALSEWFKNGPREGRLKSYPYKNFDEYVQAYCNDIASCIEVKKGHTTAL